MGPRNPKSIATAAGTAQSKSKNAGSQSVSDSNHELETLRKKIAQLEKEKKSAEKGERSKGKYCNFFLAFEISNTVSNCPEVREKSKAIMREEDTFHSDEEAEVENDPEADEDDPPQSSSVVGK